MTAGIYLITCTANNDRYVGSARNLLSRRREHWSNLRLKRHHNTHMQNVWNKYGSGTFVFEALEEIADVAILIEREQFWIDQLCPELNKAKKAESGFAGLVHSDATRVRLSEIQRQRMQSAERRQLLRDLALKQPKVLGVPVSEAKRRKLRNAALTQFSTSAARAAHSKRMKEVMTPEVCERIRQSKLGLEASPETRQQMSVSHTRQWAEYTPEQREARIASTSAAVVAAKAKLYDGFVSPDGIEYRAVHNLAAFCREHGLLNSKMGQVATGKRKQHKGWRRLES
jgi:group I intron endonuclease